MSKVANCFGPYLSLERSDRDDFGTNQELGVVALQRYRNLRHSTSVAKDMGRNSLELGTYFYDHPITLFSFPLRSGLKDALLKCSNHSDEDICLSSRELLKGLTDATNSAYDG